MSIDFHHTPMGARFFNQQLPELTRVLGRLADVLAGRSEVQISSGATCPPDFFRALMDGDWDVFQELSTPTSAQYREKRAQAMELSHQLQMLLGTEHCALLEQYQATLLAEESKQLEHAFLTGYQTAVKLILMGVTPQNTLLQEES